MFASLCAVLVSMNQVSVVQSLFQFPNSGDIVKMRSVVQRQPEIGHYSASPIVMTGEQSFFFDLKTRINRFAVRAEAEIEALKSNVAPTYKNASLRSEGGSRF